MCLKPGFLTRLATEMLLAFVNVSGHHRSAVIVRSADGHYSRMQLGQVVDVLLEVQVAASETRDLCDAPPSDVARRLLAQRLTRLDRVTSGRERMNNTGVPAA